MKVYRNGLRRAWYDRALGLWTCQVVDASDNQVGDVEYDSRREMAMRWLKTGNFFEPKNQVRDALQELSEAIEDIKTPSDYLPGDKSRRLFAARVKARHILNQTRL